VPTHQNKWKAKPIGDGTVLKTGSRKGLGRSTRPRFRHNTGA